MKQITINDLVKTISK